MTEDRQPNYDFYAPVPPSAAGPPVPPGAANNTFSGPNASTIRGVVVSSSQVSYGQSLPPRRSGLPVWLIVLIAGAASVFLIGILAAIAIPVFLNQRMKAQYQDTTVSLPGSLNGAARNLSPKAQALAKTFASDEIPPSDIAIYGPLGSKVVILLAVKLPAVASSGQQEAERAGFEKGFASTSKGAVLPLVHDPVPDKLGGWLGCGNTSEGVHVCLATDVASLVAVISGPDAGDPVTLTRRARAATVSRP